MESPTDTNNTDGSDCTAATCSRLIDLCQELIGYLETVEESDNGREFHPTTIESCRCLVVDRLGKIIPEIKSICENAEVCHADKSLKDQ